MHRCDTQPPHSVWDQLKYTSLLTILFFLIIINSHTRSVIQSDRHQIHMDAEVEGVAAERTSIARTQLRPANTTQFVVVSLDAPVA